MSLLDRSLSTIHASALNHARSLLRPVRATAHADGALRYQCPVTESFVQVTDDRTLVTLMRPCVRPHCASCGETHLLLRSQSEEADATPSGDEVTM